jgi:hypothetical protein
VLRCLTIRLFLVEAIETTKRGSVLVLHFAAMAIEQRQRGAVAVANPAFAVGDENGFSERIQRRRAQGCPLVNGRRGRPVRRRPGCGFLHGSSRERPSNGRTSHSDDDRYEPGDWILDGVHRAIARDQCGSAERCPSADGPFW